MHQADTAIFSVGLVIRGRSFYRVDGIEFCRWNQKQHRSLAGGRRRDRAEVRHRLHWTEHGVASLRMDVNETAQALIGVAAPEHRDMLQAAWRELQSNRPEQGDERWNIFITRALVRA